jgi:signal transduction histidine kinase
VRLFSSLQSKLILAFVSVVSVALVLAATVFIVVRRDDQEQREVDKVAAAAPEVLGEYRDYLRFARNPDGSEPSTAGFVRESAAKHAIRIMLIDGTNQITADSANAGDSLLGKVLTFPVGAGNDVSTGPPGFPVARPGAGDRGYLVWSPDSGQVGDGLVLVSSALSPLNVPAGGRVGPVTSDGRLVLAVPQSTISKAWVSLLPGLGLAALIALPVAVLLALLLARYITRPIHELTVASQQMAAGTFDIRVPLGRKDELGQLAEAFAEMAERVGGAHTQMRTLVANVSHDLKTPLTSILGFARALHTSAAPPEDVARIGGIIEEEALRLSTRLNDLLLLSELDSGKAMVSLGAVDISALVEGAAERLLPAGPERQFSVELELDGSLLAHADGMKLERAVENLLDNARKFTPAGGSIRLRTASAAGGEDTATIEIANTCDEVPDEEMGMLFDRFYRRDRARSARTPGSGLGLAIARDLVRLQGGTMTAASRDGFIVFTIALPAAR